MAARMWKSSFLQAGSNRTHYLEAGSGEPLVLVHGFGMGNSAELAWGKVLPRLAQRLHVYAPDMLGFGDTDCPAIEYSYQNQLDHLRSYLDTLSLSRVLLMGNSVGAYLVIRFALDFPERVVGVFGLGSGTLANAMELKEPEIPARKLMRQFDGSRDAMRNFLKVVMHRPENHTEDAVAARLKNMEKPGVLEAMQAFHRYAQRLTQDPDERQRFSVKDRLPALKVPMAMVWGLEDQWAPVILGYELEKRLPNIQFSYLADCGHTVQNDDPEALASMARTFFEGITAKAEHTAVQRKQ